jgi:hypothetical protein
VLGKVKEITGMIDTQTAMHTRNHKPDRGRTLYPCTRCKRNSVRKQGGLCRSCAAKIREERLIAEGVPRTWNRTHRKNKTETYDASCPKSPTGAHVQIITANGDGSETGECVHCLAKFHYTKMDESGNRFLESNRRGGRKAGKLRGGRRGRPRKDLDAWGGDSFGDIARLAEGY